jgi:hypothetical protein
LSVSESFPARERAPCAVGVERFLLRHVAGFGSATGSPVWSGLLTRRVGYRPLDMMNQDADPNGFDPELAELEELSNGALDLIERGRLDEAERACLELKKRFPDQIDWIEHFAALHLARGQVGRAIECYHECLAHIDRYPDGFDSDSRAWYRDEIARLRSQHAR